MEKSIQKFNHILDLQVELNNLINPDWKTKNYPFATALWVELGELLGHAQTWKWWKRGSIDRQQVLLELVDILHFGMSVLLQSGIDITEHVVDAFERSSITKPRPYVECIESIVFKLVDPKYKVLKNTTNFKMWDYLELLAAFDISFDDIYTLFIAKHTLNCFRQANGYNTGTYVKQWQTPTGVKEDNEVLFDIINELTLNKVEPTADIIYLNLLVHYHPAPKTPSFRTGI